MDRPSSGLGDHRRYPAEDMRYRLRTLLIAILLAATAIVCIKYRYQPSATGEFMVQKEDLPKNIVELAKDLEWIRPICSKNEFQNALNVAGLKKQPDFWKDLGYFWYVDTKLKPTIPANSDYRISLSYHSHDSKIMVYHGAIHEMSSNGGHGEIIWEIAYPH